MQANLGATERASGRAPLQEAEGLLDGCLLLQFRGAAF